MVERLKQAIEKARLEREAQVGAVPPVAGRTLATTRSDVDEHWNALHLVDHSNLRLEANRIISADRSHSGHADFDNLRTRIMKLCRDNGWSQITVTSPTRGCGKTMVTTNLAFSIARNQNLRTLLMELDMRAPALKRIINNPREHGVDELLSGRIGPEEAAIRLRPNLAVCMGSHRITDSAELLMQPSSLQNIAALRSHLTPDITLYDMPPLFGCDDTLAFLPNVDAVLLVAAAGTTTADDIKECEQLIGDSAVLLGVVMNKVNKSTEGYGYGNADVSA